MMPMHEFCMILAKDEVQDTLEIAKWRTVVREEVKEVSQLNRIERAYYDIIAARERQKYRLKWLHYFQRGLAYKHPYLVNA